MKQEIRQNGETILESDDNISIPIIFNNLTGKNSKDNREYQAYINYTAIPLMGFQYGKIELWDDGKFKEIGLITKYKLLPQTYKDIVNNKRLDKCSMGYQIGNADAYNHYGIYWDTVLREEIKQEFIKLFGIKIR